MTRRSIDCRRHAKDQGAETVTPPLHTRTMSNQLRLIDAENGARSSDWRLDEHTREIGRNGIAAARAALRASRARYAAPETRAA